MATPVPAGGSTAERAGLPVWRWLLALALPVALVIAVLVFARQVPTDEDPDAPLAVPAVFQPGSATADCLALDAVLPAALDGLPRRTLIASEPGVAAWGNPPVVLRCGIADPAELTCSSALTVYNGVSWLTIPSTSNVTYIAVDRGQRVALTTDNSVGVGVVQELSNSISSVMTARPVCVQGVVNPVDPP